MSRLPTSWETLAGGDSGLDVLSASCTEADGELQYQGSGGGSFFDIETDGSGNVKDLGGGRNATIEVAADGSGMLKVLDPAGGNLTIEVAADGSGLYKRLSPADGNLEIEVGPDGTGLLKDLSPGSGNLEIEIQGEGAGRLKDLTDGRNVSIDVEGNGAGRYKDLTDGLNETLEADAEGALSYKKLAEPDNVTLEVEADGSGELKVLSTDRNIEITVDADGNGTYRDALNNVDESFDAPNGLLDPEVVIASPLPNFAVADGFPPLDTLGQVEPPCVTVIRLDADVLFDFDSDQLRPEANTVVDSVAEVLLSTDRSIEIQGHTDSMGSDEYNLDLSERRAASFEAALIERGVTGELATAGFGESRPVAPNENPDGSDNPAGRQLNRRVEVVLGS